MAAQRTLPAKQITLNMALAVDSISFDAVRVALNLVANMQLLEMTARFFIQRLEQSGISEQRRQPVSEINYQALREAAQNAKNLGGIKNYKRGEQAVAEFKSLITPHIVLALLDERERNQQYIKRRDQENEDIALTVGKLRVELEEVKQHAEELSETKAVRNQWRPDICPITGRAFFMWIEHPTLGNVPTYGGPLDSYTIPTKDGDGEFSCERYDHDFGGWVESECLGLYLIDDEEQCRVYELEERVKELDAREIKPAKGEVLVVVSGFTGCGKSAIAGEIEIAMKAIGVPVQWTNGDAEKRMTGAD